MTRFVDSHCHLDYPALAKDRAGVVARARQAGVVRLLNVATTRRDSEIVLATANDFEDVFCSFGVHPHHVAEAGEDVSIDTLIAKTAAPKVVALGETGLDYFYDKAPREIQQESFRRHIRAAQATKLPLIIHSRDAEDDTIRLLTEGGAVTGVMHCFSSRRILAEEAVALGFYISLSGILTFKKSEELRAIVRDVPLDKLLIETDAPYLAPEPFRGKICEPAYVIKTAQRLAEVKGVTLEEIARVTTDNFFRLFSKVTALP